VKEKGPLNKWDLLITKFLKTNKKNEDEILLKTGPLQAEKNPRDRKKT